MIQHDLFTTDKKTNKLRTCLKLHNVSVAELFKKQASWPPSQACFPFAYNNINSILLLFTNKNPTGGCHLSSPNHISGSVLTISLRQVLSLSLFGRWRKHGVEKLNNLSKVTQLVSDKAKIQIQVSYYSLWSSTSNTIPLYKSRNKLLYVTHYTQGCTWSLHGTIKINQNNL